MMSAKPDVNHLLELVIGVEAGLDNITSIINKADADQDLDENNLEVLKGMLNQVEVEFQEAINKLEKILDPEKPKRNREFPLGTAWKKFKKFFRRN